MKLQQLLFNGLLGLALITAASCSKSDDSTSTTTSCKTQSISDSSSGSTGRATITTNTYNSSGALTRQSNQTAGAAAPSSSNELTNSADGLTVTQIRKDSLGMPTDTTIRTLNSSKYIVSEKTSNATTTNSYDANGYLTTSIRKGASSSDTTWYSYTNGNRTMERTKSDTVFYTYGSDVVPSWPVPADGFDGKRNTNLPTTKKTKNLTATITYEKNSNGYPTKTTFSVPAYTIGSNTYPASTYVTTFTYTCQ